MVIDSFQKRSVMNMEVRHCFSRAKPFPLKKARFCLFFCFFSKKATGVQKSQNFKIWVQKFQFGNPAVNCTSAMMHDCEA